MADKGEFGKAEDTPAMKVKSPKIKEAILLGRKMVMYPSMAPFVFPLIFNILSRRSQVFSFGEPTNSYLTLGLFLGSFIASWLLWSIQIPKWRLKAYAMVDDIVELKKAAVAAQLIWPDNSIFGKTEIASPELRKAIGELENSKKVVNSMGDH